MGRSFGTGNDAEERGEEIREREQGEKDPVAERRAETLAQAGVDEQLQGYADHSENCKRETDLWRRKCETTSEVKAVWTKARWMRIRRVVAWGGEEDVPERVESPQMHCK